jgi:hypothetical protein
MRKKAQRNRSTQRPSKRAARASLARPRRASAGRPTAARRPVRRCDDRSIQSRHPQAPSQESAAPARNRRTLPLTLCGMQGSRHRPHRPSSRVFGLLSALVLLALACVVPAAYAETVYEPESTNIPNEVQPIHQPKTPASHPSSGGNQTGAESHASTVPSEAGEGSGETEESSSGGIGSSEGNGPGNGQGNGNKNPAQGSQGNGTNTTQAQPVKATTGESDGGDSSSPLVPILIALAALAAISVGAVVLRQRRQRGGPDGSVSSPKAS